MNGALTNYLEDALMAHVFGGTAYNPATAGGAGTIYLGLLTNAAAPDDTGAGTEVAYTNYARKAIAFSPAAGGVLTQNGDVLFDQCGVTGADAYYYALYDASSAGNMLAYGQLSTFPSAKSISQGNTPSVASGQVTLTVAAGGMSNFLANTLLDFAFRNVTPSFTGSVSQPSIHMFLATVDAAAGDSGAALTEPANNYGRVNVTAWTVTNNAAENTNEETFPTPNGTWGAIDCVGLADATTGGNVLFFDNAPTGAGQTPDNGDTVKFAAGAFDVSLD